MRSCVKTRSRPAKDPQQWKAEKPYIITFSYLRLVLPPRIPARALPNVQHCGADPLVRAGPPGPALSPMRPNVSRSGEATPPSAADQGVRPTSAHMLAPANRLAGIMLTTMTDSLRARYEALLEVSDSIASHQSLPALFHALTPCLAKLVSFAGLGLMLYDPERRVTNLHPGVLGSPPNAGRT